MSRVRSARRRIGGIFIVLALLIGIPVTSLYLLARIGDRKP
jgi:hypothetical protein